MRTFSVIAGTILILCAAVYASETINSSSQESDSSSKNSSTISSQAGQSSSQSPHYQTLPTGTDIIKTPGYAGGYLIISSLSSEGDGTSLQIGTAAASLKPSASWSPLAVSSHVVREQRDTSRTFQQFVTKDQNAPEILDSDQKKISQKTFFLHVTSAPLHDPHAYRPFRANLLCEGKRTRVYLDKNCETTQRLQQRAEGIIRCLDDHIIPQADKLVGPFADVDRDGKLTVVLTPWLDELQGGKTSLKGFVKGSDFRPHYPRPFSNRGDIIYLNSQSTKTHDLTLLAHEYWHVLQFSLRLCQHSPPLPIQEDWISEGSAHLAELTFGGNASNLEHRIEAWLTAPEESPLTVANYYSAGLWRHDGCRGGVFLFLRWCAHHYGESLLTDILNSPETGGNCLKGITGEELATLQSLWLVAMLRGSLSTDETFSASDDDKAKEMFRGGPFAHLSFGTLKIHPLKRHSTEPLKIQLAPTAATFLKIEAGQRLRIRSSTETPLRVIFVPRAERPRLAKQSLQDSQS